MSVTDETIDIQERQRELLHEEIREMTDYDAYCPNCEKEFDSVTRVVSHQNNTHMIEVEKVHQEEVCEFCDETFIPDEPTNTNRFCSRECYRNGDTEIDLVTYECARDDCSDTNTVHRAAYEQQDMKFCSHSCAHRGEEHWAWKGGSDKIRKTPEYTQWLNEIHGSTDSCEECGSESNLQAHHIVPVSENKELATDVDNGILLCGECHSDKHPELHENTFK